jgi:Tol biopolymer transport system component
VIDSVRLDGSDRRTLFGTPETSAQNARWSPDGTRVAYSLGTWGIDEVQGRYADVYVARADGSGRVRLTHGKGIESNPAWSPDGRWLAFERVVADGDEDEIWLVRSDGSERRRLTAGAFDTTPTWTPDGSTVVFDRWQSDTVSTLFRIGADGQGLRRLGSARRVGDASFAPDGSRFVAQRTRGSDPEESQIGLYTAKGKLIRMLTLLGEDWSPSFSPDGKSIAFVRDGGVAVMNADGTGIRVLTDGAQEGDDEPAWFGDRLSFDVWPVESSLDVLDVRSNRVRTVARDSDADQVAWSRQGLIAYTAEGGDALHIRNLASGRLLGVVKQSEISNIVWGAGGRTVFFEAGSIKKPGLFYGYDATGRRVARLSLRGASDLTWSPNHRWAALVEGGDADHGTRLALFDSRTRRLHVIVRRAGIRKGSPEWDRASRRIAFVLERTPHAFNGDVFIVARTGGRLRQVTHAFPDGGDNWPLAWIRGMRPLTEPRPRVQRVQPRVLARGGKVLALSADGDRLSYALSGPNASCGRLHVRLIGARSDSFAVNPCRGGADLRDVRADAGTVAWVLFHSDTGAGDDDRYCLYAVPSSGARSVNGQRACDDLQTPCRPPLVAWDWGQLTLAGSDNAIISGSVNYGYCLKNRGKPDPEVVRVDPKRVTPLVYTGNKLRLVDADSSHLLLQEGDRILVVYDLRGSMLRVLHLRAPVSAALLDGSRVVILSGRVLGERDLWSGRAVGRVVLPKAFGKLTLDDAAGGLVAYTQGIVVHVLRFSDRHNAAIWNKSLAQVGRVLLTPSGLVAAAQLSDRARGGVIALISTPQLLRALG